MSMQANSIGSGGVGERETKVEKESKIIKKNFEKLVELANDDKQHIVKQKGNILN